MGSIAITSNYRQVQRILKEVDPQLQKQLRKDLRSLSDEVVAEARAAASWSEKIPPAIRPMSGATVGVRVLHKVAIATLNERKQGKWRHPVFGRWLPNQKDQIARPSVWPVVNRHRPELERRAGVMVRAALREAGL